MTTRTLPRHARTGMLAAGWRKARTGETPGELYPIWPVLGGAPDDEDEDEGEEEDEKDPALDDAGDEQDEDEKDPEGADELGDKGKKALDAMKTKLRTERDRRKAAETERDQLKKPADDKDDPEQIRAEADRAATARANGRIVRSEVKAAAKGRLADAADALVFLDLTQFDVDGDGQVDEDDVEEAITQLLKDKPHLAAATAKRFQGSGDGGARKGPGAVKQLGKNDLKTMTAEQIDAAREKGQLRDYLNE